MNELYEPVDEPAAWPLVDVTGHGAGLAAGNAAQEFVSRLEQTKLWPGGDAVYALRRAAGWGSGEAWAWRDGRKAPPDREAFECAMLLALGVE